MAARLARGAPDSRTAISAGSTAGGPVAAAFAAARERFDFLDLVLVKRG